MTKFKRHTTEEMNNWEKTQANELAKIRASQHHLIYNLIAYVVISIIEYWLAEISKSQTLRADAFNNLSGIISTFLLMMGLHIAQDVDDDDIIGARLPSGNYQAHMGSDQLRFSGYSPYSAHVRGTYPYRCCREMFQAQVLSVQDLLYCD